MGIAVGIDLGTSNTVVACVRDGRAVTLADDEGRRLIPSIVSFHPNGSVLVGDSAKDRRLIDPANTIYSVKRLIGRSWGSDEVQQARGRFPFELREGSKNSTLVVARGETLRLAGDERVRPASGESDRGEGARRDGRPRRRHRPRELQRPAARVHEGGGQARRPRGAPHPERADRGRARLRPDHEPERAPRRLRPRRRHVRHHAPRSVRATSSRSSPRPATRPSAGTTSISSSPTSWRTRSSARTASIRAST